MRITGCASCSVPLSRLPHSAIALEPTHPYYLLGEVELADARAQVRTDQGHLTGSRC
jgi:hypothetical protein